MKDSLHSTVTRFIRTNSLLNGKDKVIVALSGGADSVALLHFLVSFKEKYNLSLYAAHLNHGIRGEEADRDQAFVGDLCRRYGVPLFCEKADVPAAAERSGESPELCGRRLRYAFLERTAEELGGAKIATAHHRDDNAETILWNLIRGSGLSGLSGIPVQRGNIIRPLLCCSRAEIEAYCRDNGLRFVTDSTNLSDQYTRNKLRHQVMPVLRELNPGVDESLVRSASIMREADAYFYKISEEELKKAKTAYGYSCRQLLSADPIVVRYAVKLLAESAGAPVDYRHIALITEAMRCLGAVDLGGGYTAVCSQGVLRIVRSSGGTKALCVPFSEYVQNHGTRLSVREGQIGYDGQDGKKIHSLLLNDCIPCDIITSDTVLRTRQAGDTFTDPRRGVTKTLKKLFNELKIPRELRDQIPVVAVGSTVLWIRGVGLSAQAKAALTPNGELIYMGDYNA